MPLPHWLTRVNLVFGNRLMKPFAAWLPWFGVLEHVGRTSGIVRHTPLMAFRRGDRLVIALTYGPEVQWLKNVVSAGDCRVRRFGRWNSFTDPRRFHDQRRQEVPWLIRPILALLRVNEFVELRTAAVGRVTQVGDRDGSLPGAPASVESAADPRHERGGGT